MSSRSFPRLLSSLSLLALATAGLGCSDEAGRILLDGACGRLSILQDTAGAMAAHDGPDALITNASRFVRSQAAASREIRASPYGDDLVDLYDDVLMALGSQQVTDAVGGEPPDWDVLVARGDELADRWGCPTPP